MPKILMVAAEYPPCLSAGVQRTFHFSENLNKNNWLPIVLSAHERIYKEKDYQVQVSPDIKKNVRRAFAADASVHFAIKGKYFDFLENPDKFASWYYQGWRKGYSMIKEHNPDVIWSTFPVSTAHRIAYKLKTKTGKLWVADFRDPLHCHVDDHFKSISELAKKIDSNAVHYADLLVFATTNMRDLYLKAYPGVDSSKFIVIENGYDENAFKPSNHIPQNSSLFTLLYSGGLYHHGRDPQPLFKAISELIKDGQITKENFQLNFRGSGDGVAYQAKLEELDIAQVVSFLPSIDYQKSIKEMQDATALLVLQGKVFDNQIPGKVYEYIATRKSILALTGEDSATRKVLERVPNAYSVGEFNVNQIKVGLLKMINNRTANGVEDTELYSRKRRSEELILALNKLIS